MIAAILLTVSVVALCQFALYYWRAMIAGVASHEVSDTIRVAARITSSTIGSQDFNNILVLNNLSPYLRGPNGSFRTVRAYYSVVKRLGSLIPAMASWADGEMATCARYAAVVMDQRMESNIAYATQMRGQ
jgi:hypothetical protein